MLEKTGDGVKLFSLDDLSKQRLILAATQSSHCISFEKMRLSTISMSVTYDRILFHFPAPLGLAAPNVTVNSTAANITWSPPVRDNGIIIFYEIRRISAASGERSVVNVGLQFSHSMTDMEPYTKYEFQVAASTTGGKTWSKVTEIRTSEDSKCGIST